MTHDDAPDRAAILARRALFVASAVASFAPSSRANADEVLQAPPGDDEPLCPVQAEPPPEAREEAAARLQKVRELLETPGLTDHARIAAEVRRIYAITPSARFAFLLARTEVGLGRVDDAHRLVTTHLRCFGADERLEQLRTEIETTTGRLTIVAPLGEVAALDIDGAPMDPRRAAKGIRVSAGRHVLTRTALNGGHEQREIAVARGESVVVALERLPPPMPCLSPPPPQREDSLVELGIGAFAPIVGVSPSGAPTVSGGAGGRGVIGVRIADDLWFRGDAFCGVLIGSGARYVSLGSVAELVYHFVPAYGLGAGLAGGYVLVLADERDEPYVAPSPFVGPVAVPAAIRAGIFDLEIRVPLWFTAVRDRSEESFGLGLVAPHVVLGASLPVVERTYPDGMAAGARTVSATPRSRTRPSR